MRSEHRLNEWSDYRDEIFRRFMEQLDEEQWAQIRTVEPRNDRSMIFFVKRELARGKSVSDLHKYARVVLPFIKLPIKNR